MFGFAARYYSQTRSPFAELARHFFLELFHPESAASEDSYTTWLVQILAALITASWFLPVQLFRRYSDLHALDTPEPYRLAYSSDCLSALTLMTLLVGVLTILEWPALFPSRRDHLILTPLPLTRLDLFGAKLAALLTFVTVFVTAITFACSLVLPMIASGRWESRSFVLRVAAWLISSIAVCYLTFFSLLALQGLLSVLLPVKWFEPASFAAQMTLLIALLTGFPLWFYFPARELINTGSPWLDWLPTAWFWGASERLLGSHAALPLRLSHRALLALAVSAVFAALTYLISYLRHNRYALEIARSARKPHWPAFVSRIFRTPQARAIAEFIACSIARGRQQQTVYLILFGLGLALIFESSVYIGLRLGRRGFEPNSMTVESWIVGVPLTLSFFSMVALRRAFRTPIDLPANWIFRLTESTPTRRLQLDAIFRLYIVIAGLPALVICAPLELLTLGPKALWAFPLQLVLMLALAEHLLTGWRAIPFAVAPDPARRHFIHSAILHSFELSLYSFASSAWIRTAMQDRKVFVRFGLIVFVAYAVLRYRRLCEWARDPLEFSETIHAEVEPLQLRVE